MAKHLIICLHGMGDHDAGWQNDELTKQLKDAWAGYPTLTEIGEFDSLFKIHPINYDNHFEAHVQRRREMIDSFGNIAEAASAALAELGNLGEDIMQLYDKTDIEDDSFWSTHLGDVFLYLLNPNVRELVNAYMFEQISEAYKTHKEETDGTGEVSVIAHSLGTAVITTALHQMYTDDVDFRDNYGRFHMIMTVANVANLTTVITGGNVYNSEVFPSMNKNEGACVHYINTWHDLDPFTVYKRFRPNKTEWDRTDGINAMSGHMYREVPIGALDTQNKITHSLWHYISHPKVHLEFFRYALPFPQNGEPVLESERKAMLDKWRADTLWGKIDARIGEAIDAVGADIDELKALVENAKHSDASEMIEIIKNLPEQLEAIRENSSDTFKNLVDDIEEIAKEFWNKE